MERYLSRSLVLVGLILLAHPSVQAGEVKGRVEMPDTCSPSVSPAVVTLEPLGESQGSPNEAKLAPSSVNLTINQHGLQFEPRVQVARVGQRIRFTNQDAEYHNVHILNGNDYKFNQSMAPNVPVDFVPGKPGLIKLVCDIHSHMRGYVVVTSSPWAKVCKGGGTFRFGDVPDGRYALNAWHEMGESFRKEIEVKGAEPLDLGTISLKGFPIVASASNPSPVSAWPEVIDRIGVLLSESREALKKNGSTPEDRKKAENQARKLAEDAYWGEFETSEMETAIRRYLGFERAGAIEGQFVGFRSAIKTISEGKVPPSDLVGRSSRLIADLAKASTDLQAQKIFDRRNVGKTNPTAKIAAVSAVSEQAIHLEALGAAFKAIQDQADRGLSAEAASAMTDAYFSDFDPLEQRLNALRPEEVFPLEVRFNAIRTRINAGLKGKELAADLASLRSEVDAALGRCSDVSFSLAFFNSFVTILREGVEVILLLTMLFALVAKAGQPKAVGAIRWGIGVAVVASILTAVGLNFLVASSQGRTREVVEGAVMLTAAGVLFSVSYWLIAQTQAKRWADFLKSRISQGAKVGGLWTLGLTAFLAVYREGAETALLYQAMLSGQGGSTTGIIGLVAGLGVGLLILAAIAGLIRLTSVKLPLRPFFQVTGYVLFAMAVIFAGNGVFELQSAAYIKTTPLTWLGKGLPTFGLHPNIQALSIQGLLLLGAVLALVLPGLTVKPPATKVIAPPTAGVGV
jgi:high-affinity iron transporter